MKKEFSDALPVFHIDERKIKQVFFNLLSNAIKFTEKGSVTLRLRSRNPEYGFIDIIDTGVGIPEEGIEQIFDRFHQVDSSASKKYQGTGLGLNLVRDDIAPSRRRGIG